LKDLCSHYTVHTSFDGVQGGDAADKKGVDVLVAQVEGAGL
jgi:hypothetical protein